MKFAGLYRVNYACRVTALEHNFGYLHGDSTRLWFSAHDNKDEILEERDRERRSQSRPAVKRKKTEDAGTNVDYQPRAF